MLKLTFGSVNDFSSAATVALHKTLVDKVDWISGGCWVSSVENRLKQINAAIAAWKTFVSAQQGAGVEIFSDDEIKQIGELIIPMKQLEMRGEVKAILVEALKQKGIDPSLFTEVKAQ